MCSSSRDIKVINVESSFSSFIVLISAFSLCLKEAGITVFSDLIMLSVSSELGSGKEAENVSW